MVHLRREPPIFRRVEVTGVEYPTSRLARITFGGPELEGLRVDQPAASVRLLLPSSDREGLVMPEWSGNEFLFEDGGRPIIRTFTPLRHRPEERLIDLEIVLHEGGAAARWAGRAAPGDEAAISGTGRGYDIDEDAAAYLLAGDETALPAIGQILRHLPAGIATRALVEVVVPEARLERGHDSRVSVEWLDLPEGARPGEALVATVRAIEIEPGTRVWAAGEAAAMHRIRKDIFEVRGLSRSEATVRGYWKQRG